MFKFRVLSRHSVRAAALPPLQAAPGQTSLPAAAAAVGDTRQVGLARHRSLLHRSAMKAVGTAQVAVGVPVAVPRRRMAQRRVPGGPSL